MAFTAVRRSARRMFRSSRLDHNGYELDPAPPELSQNAIEAARTIRDRERPPAIIIHGVMPRSGTVHTGQLLGLHPDLHTYPNDIFEFPFLGLTSGIQQMEQEFIRMYRRNGDRIARHDFLPLFGASLIRYLYSFVPEGKRMLLKAPNVPYLGWFPVVFPFESLLLLMRDGRDVVSSTIRTWPGKRKRFGELCELWSRSARVLLDFEDRHADRVDGFLFARFESIVRDPVSFVISACDAFALDPGAYPFEQIAKLPVRGSSTVVSRKPRGSGWDPTEKPKDFNPVGRWTAWTPAQKRTFKRIAGEVLMEAGYCRGLDW